MGAATVCSTTSALAPAYWVLTLTVGRVMSGTPAGRHISCASRRGALHGGAPNGHCRSVNLEAPVACLLTCRIADGAEGLPDRVGEGSLERGGSRPLPEDAVCTNWNRDESSRQHVYYRSVPDFPLPVGRTVPSLTFKLSISPFRWRKLLREDQLIKKRRITSGSSNSEDSLVKPVALARADIIKPSLDLNSPELQCRPHSSAISLRNGSMSSRHSNPRSSDLGQSNWITRSTPIQELTLHQIAPYIGRMRIAMARSLVLEYTRPGDVVVDPFCGCGVVPLEAAVQGRSVVAGDVSPYAYVLTRAKLYPPRDLVEAKRRLATTYDLSLLLRDKQDLSAVPEWVSQFFHPVTLQHALAFRDACVELSDHFLLACLLGILHHQRPGFLSYPSSHLVPYLRDKKFPRESFPELYEPRDLLPRLTAKIGRTLTRTVPQLLGSRKVYQRDARSFPRVRRIDAVITSPPYMNALDYIRDNRLRLWFINKHVATQPDFGRAKREERYAALISDVIGRLASRVPVMGHIIMIVGDTSRGSKRSIPTDEITTEIFSTEKRLRVFELTERIRDHVPDIRRSRKTCNGTRTETILVYEKNSS
jgi:hypothetical protein